MDNLRDDQKGSEKGQQFRMIAAQLVELNNIIYNQQLRTQSNKDRNPLCCQQCGICNKVSFNSNM